MSNDKLAEALRDSVFVAAMLDAICETDGTVDRMKARDAACRVREALQVHAAEAAHFAPPYPDAAQDPFWSVPGMVDTRPEAAQAQSQTAEPVGEVVGVTGSVGEMRVIRWRGRYSPEVGTKLYTHPQPAQDALKAVLEVALSIMDANDPLNAARLRKMRDAAMAKESGNG